MQFKVANIEDETFPRFPTEGSPTVPAGSRTLPADEITVQNRTEYRRHTLNGVNLFTLEMFDQFRTELGLYAFDAWLPVAVAPQVSSHDLAVSEGVTMAQTTTAQVNVVSSSNSGTKIQVDVKVQNLAGHNLPSGVSFRRAFLDRCSTPAGRCCGNPVVPTLTA
jgi:hypothetical protein